MNSTPDTPIIPSATVLLVKDIEDDFEIFMVTRHHKIKFAGGALVFPGGKLDPEDSDEALLAACRGQKGPTGVLTDEDLAFRICGIRETFEEAGVLLARDNETADSLSGERGTELAQQYREALHGGEITLAEIVQAEGLTLACDQMIVFARWVTPTYFPKRFDTFFFLARVPRDQIASHDDIESTDSLWTTPTDAIADGDEGRKVVVFATRANLGKLALSKSVDELIENTLKDEIVIVEPVITDNDGDITFRIRDDAGYPLIERTEYGGSVLKVKK
ncbi:MAG: NUDIX hydrolase [Rhodospirillaceae bacterium]|jgi:8-oxo-dGTP pyrophosphatase MutT (NUDIX family)|nr:NUDIX hydrolase [Rhodospirillaceae bacterium]MBT7954322.1 NUDIX hydrolase [Rhodospirillaceae bacterium]